MKHIQAEIMDNINIAMLKERSYLNIAKKFCEIEREKSERIAGLYVLLVDICKIHDELFDLTDEAFINSGSLFVPK